MNISVSNSTQNSTVFNPYDLDDGIWYLPWWQSIVAPLTSMLCRFAFIQLAICFPGKVANWRNQKVQESEKNALKYSLVQCAQNGLSRHIGNPHLVNLVTNYLDNETCVAHEKRIDLVMVDEYKTSALTAKQFWGVVVENVPRPEREPITDRARTTFGNLYNMSYQFEKCRAVVFVWTIVLLVAKIFMDIGSYSLLSILHRSALRTASVGIAPVVGFFTFLEDANPDFARVSWPTIHNDSSGKPRHVLLRIFLFFTLAYIVWYMAMYIGPSMFIYLPQLMIVMFFKFIAEFVASYCQVQAVSFCCHRVDATSQGAASKLSTILINKQILLSLAEISMWCVPAMAYFYHGQNNGSEWWENFAHTFRQKASSQTPATWFDWFFLLNSLL